MTYQAPMCPPPIVRPLQMPSVDGIPAGRGASVVNHALIPAATQVDPCSTTAAPSPSAAPCNRVSRRTVMLNAAIAIPTLAASQASPLAPAIEWVQADPALAVIDQLTAAHKSASDIYCALDEAESEAKDRFGPKPACGISWRDYSWIGGDELDAARDDFLSSGLDPVTVAAEYIDAKERERAAQQTQQDWYQKSGLADLETSNQQAWAEANRLEDELEATMPTTMAGAVALLAFVAKELSGIASDTLHVNVLKNAIEFLRPRAENAVPATAAMA